MTKRFVVKKYSIKDMSIDEKYVNSRYYIGDKGIAQSLCDLLNELHDEIQDLKSFNKDLAEELSACANARISKDDWIETLTEENEQLKKDREELFIRERDTKNEWRELKQENEQLKQDIEYYKIERLALFEYLDKKDDLKLELKVEK